MALHDTIPLPLSSLWAKITQNHALKCLKDIALAPGYLSILYPAIPIGLVLSHTHAPDLVVFIVNFLAIIPLAAVISFATEELGEHLGPIPSGMQR